MATLSPPQTPNHNHDHDTRPRASTVTSFMSNKSRRSSHSNNKLELTESSKDKRRLNIMSKADPRAALNEAQPAAMASAETTIEDLRQTQHKDVDGTIIADPDRSNPTRYRLERPLDTIRKWNAAAEGTSNNRRSSYQNRPPSFGGDNRRSSSYMSQNGYPSPQGRPRPSHGGYYNRQSSYGARQDGYPEEGMGQPPYGRPPRQQGQAHYGIEESPASGHSYQQSYETMTSGSDEYGKSTNPSSQNSSFDRLHQMQARKPDEHGSHYDNEMQYAQQNGNGMRGAYAGGYDNDFNQPPPRPGPPAAPNNPRQPIKLNGANSGPPPTQADLQRAMPEKRQSWIKRRFSKRE